MAEDEECGRPIGGTELLFEREFVEFVDRVARNTNQSQSYGKSTIMLNNVVNLIDFGGGCLFVGCFWHYK